MIRSLQIALCGFALASSILISEASAQTYGTDYLSFKGWGVILDNPIAAPCAAAPYNFSTNQRFEIVYRFSANPSLIADAFTFRTESGTLFRIISTQSPNFSLSGASTTNWEDINRKGDFHNGSSSSNLTILSGLGQPVGLATGNLKVINGQITDFDGISGCNITNFHGAAVAIPQ